MSLAFINLGPSELQQPVVEGLSIVAQTLLGGIAIFGVLIAVLSVWKLIGVQESYTDRSDKQSEKMEKLVENMTNTVSKFDKTIDRLIESERHSQEVQQDHMNLLGQMKQAIDTALRDAIIALSRNSGRSYSSPSIPRPDLSRSPDPAGSKE